MEINCSVCGSPIDDGQSVIVGIEQEGRLRFRWACQHKPVGDAAVVLSSNICVIRWLAGHQEYEGEIEMLLAAADRNPRHPGCEKDVSNGLN